MSSRNRIGTRNESMQNIITMQVNIAAMTT